MRILLAHNQFTVTGGAEVFYHEIARLLRAQGHAVALFSCHEDGLEAPGAELFPVVPGFRELGTLAKIARLPAAIYNRDAKRRFAETIARFRPDIVHAFAIYSRLTPSILDAAREAGVPVVLSSNDYKIICPNYKLYHHGVVCEDCRGGRFYNALKNRCCHGSLPLSAACMAEAYVHSALDIWRRNVTTFLFASRFMQGRVEAFWGKGRVRTDILQNPFDAAANRVAPNVGGSVLYFGRLIDEKGVDVLVEAARLAPMVEVVVVGNGPDRDVLEQAARGLDNVQFVGPAWGADLQRYLYEARAVVVPSVWHENFPYVILQAFAAYTPVIGARRGGIPELVEAGPHGWTYEALDPQALAAVLREVRATPDERIATMGEVAQSYVEVKFADDTIYSELERIYGEALA